MWSQKNDKKTLCHSLHADEVSITSTDTVFGFLSSLSSASYQEINRLKKRPAGKPYLVLISDVDKLATFVAPDQLTKRLTNLINRAWPGPLTIIFRANANLDSHLTSNGTIALRCPDHDGLRDVLTSFDGLISTSANISGQPVPEQLEDLEPELVNTVAHLVVDNETTPTPLPSSIIDVSNIYSHDESGTIKVVRQGAYPINKLEGYYGESFEQ